MAQRQLKHGEFQTHLFGCCSSGKMWMGCCCPCALVDKTQDLIELEDKKDYVTRADPSGCGIWGCAWCFLNMAGGWGLILGCMQRGKIRKLDKTEISGNCCTDFLVNFCCPCCAVIQQYKEVEIRRDKIINDGYRPQPQMQS